MTGFKLFSYILASALFISAFSRCTPTKMVKQDDHLEYELDTIIVDANDSTTWQSDLSEEDVTLYPYSPSATRQFDLKHTKLILSFDWSKQQVKGIAELTAAPLFYEQNKLKLDAINFIIHEVYATRTNHPLTYNYDGRTLEINLQRFLKKGEDITITINYTARPNEGQSGGSAAISSDKGLFFIDPLNEDPDKPEQIWSQGETENNSKWFPTFDKPNERCTQEMYLTVDQKYTTLSNGSLISTVVNSDGSRTDYWKQDKPHAPYLFMIAIGEFAKVTDMWNGIPVEYYVEKKYEPYAREIFNHTPEMLTFFSEKLDYPYPWSKFAQIITRDYVSGAMENTTAVIFSEAIQKTSRELIDDDNDNIVAHEMFHHWFGDLVTCESWANLTLNEGFANYAEYLWTEHKYGVEKADHHRMNEADGYIQNTFTTGTHPLIHYHYADKELMFDAHSYNKGGLVLHYLRSYLGDEAFFAGLHKYLKDNEFTSVEVDNLRLAFEEICGEDLNWFFDQWYLSKGHVNLEVKYDYNAKSNEAIIYTQSLEGKPFKTFYDAVIVDAIGNATYHRVWTTKDVDTIIIKDVKSEPLCIALDGKGVVPGIITESKSQKAWFNQFKYLNTLELRIKAFTNLEDETELKNSALNLALDEKYYLYKAYALNTLTDDKIIEKYALVEDMAKNGPHSELRSTALSRLFAAKSDQTVQIAKFQITNDKSYPVINNALVILAQTDSIAALEYADKLSTENSERLLGGIASVYAKSGNKKYLPWMKEKLRSANVYLSYELFSQYAMYLLYSPEIDLLSNLDVLKEIAGSSNQNAYKKYFATATIYAIKMQLEAMADETPESNTYSLMADELTRIIQEIKINEKNPVLKERYLEF